MRPQEVLRPAGEQDLGGLVRLEQRAFEDAWSPSLVAAELAQPAALILVGEVPTCAGSPGALAGYAAFRLAAGEAELLRIAVDPDHRGGGLGRRLLEAGLAALRERSVEACFLEVREDNTPALELYCSTGFQPVGRRASYFQDGSGALLYRLDFPGNTLA